MAFNEELLMQFMIDHYRSRFPDCKIIVYDNESTDNTAQIAKDNGCEIRPYLTNGKVDDELLKNHKNNCWKSADTNWVLVCDVDELLDIDINDLKNEEALGVSIIKPEGYNMINHEENLDFKSITYGARETAYDKYYLFNKSLINEINYNHGAHVASPIGVIKFSDKAYKLYHYKCINFRRIIERSKMTVARHSDINIKNNWGHNNTAPEQQVLDYWNLLKSRSVKIR